MPSRFRGSDAAASLKRRRVIRCYAQQSEGRWEAFCLDFDLAVQGDTFDSVYSDLNKAVAEYFEYVGSLPADEQAAFLNRVAPLGMRLRFLWHVFCEIAVSGNRGNRNGGNRVDFLLPAHA